MRAYHHGLVGLAGLALGCSGAASVPPTDATTDASTTGSSTGESDLEDLEACTSADMESFEGEHFIIRARPDLELCGGTMRHLDDFIERLSARFDIEPPRAGDRICYAWLHEQEVQDYCKFSASVDGCTSPRQIVTSRTPHNHELVHSMAFRLARHYPPAFLAEGLAVAHAPEVAWYGELLEMEGEVDCTRDDASHGRLHPQAPPTRPGGSLGPSPGTPTQASTTTCSKQPALDAPHSPRSQVAIQGRPGPDLGPADSLLFKMPPKDRVWVGAQPSSAAEPTIGSKHPGLPEGEDLSEAGRRPGPCPLGHRRSLIRARPARATLPELRPPTQAPRVMRARQAASRAASRARRVISDAQRLVLQHMLQ